MSNTNRYPNSKILAEKAFVSGFGQLCLLFISIWLMKDTDLNATDGILIGLLILTNVGRIFLGKTYLTKTMSEKQWYISFSAVTLTSSLAWSLLCCFFLVRYTINNELPVLILIINAGISAAATAGLSPDRRLAHAFTTVAVIPIATTLLFLLPKSHVEIACVLLIYMGFLFAQIKIQTNTILSLRDSQEKLKALGEASLEATVIHRDGIIIEANNTFEKVLGFKPNEVIGTHLMSYVPAEDRERVGKLMGINDTSHHVRGVKKDGTIIEIEAIGRWFDYMDERLRVTFIRDITFRVKAEKDLRANAEEIERLALDREKAAIEAIKVKTDFLANMSHEIRTPLNAIIGIADLLDETSDMALRRRYTDTLKNSSESLLTLVNDILDFSKIDEKKLELEFVPFKFSTLVEGQCELVANKAKDKQIGLSTFLDPNLPQLVESDFARLGQIILNLLTNAIKFTEDGEVSINCHPKDRRGSFTIVRFEVKDSGMGISPDAALKLFKPFSQADSSMSRKHGGTGLGLSICKKIIESLNGQIGFENRTEGGTMFWFEIPVKVLDHRKISDLYKDKVGNVAKIKILSDNMDNIGVVESYIKTWGFDTSTQRLSELDMAHFTSSGVEIIIAAAHTLLETKFDELRSLQKSGKLKIIGLKSADFLSWTQEEIDHAKLTSDKLLSQPLRQSDLFNTINELSISKIAIADANKKNKLTNEKAKEQFEPARVLVVEDNSTNQMIILSTLRNLGLNSQAVANGVEAVSTIEQDNKYDLILMDCQMPEMDGYEATTRIRKHEKEKGGHIPIIALTANIFDADREKCFQCGMDGFVAKPVRREKLVEALKVYLKTKDQAA